MFTKSLYICTKGSILCKKEGDGRSGGNPEVKKPNEIRESTGVNQFMEKYPKASFAQKIQELLIKHPHVSRSGVGLNNEFKDIQDQIKKLGPNIDPSYKAMMETAEVLMKHPDFAKYTGTIDIALRGGFKEDAIKEFHRNMRKFLELSLSTGKPLSLDTFSKQFDKNRPLTKEERTYIDVFYLSLLDEIDRFSNKADRMRVIDNAMRFRHKIGNQTVGDVVDSKIKSDLTTIRSRIESDGIDGGLKSELGDYLRTKLGMGRTNENKKQAYDEADRLRIKDGKPRTVHFDTEKKMYVIFTNEEIVQKLMEPNLGNLNRGLFQSFLTSPTWKDDLVNIIGPYGLAAVGLYISKMPDTLLFKGHESKKDFFISYYKRSESYISELFLESKLDQISGDIVTLFPNVMKVFPTLRDKSIFQESLKKGDIVSFYNALVEIKMSNRQIAEIMKAMEGDAKALKESTRENVKKMNANFHDSTLEQYQDQFDLRNLDDKKEFDRIGKKKIAQSGLTEKEKNFLLEKANKGSLMKKYFETQKTQIIAAQVQAKSYKGKEIAQSLPPETQAIQLDPKKSENIESAGNVGKSVEIMEQNTDQYQNNPEMKKLMSDDARLKKREELLGKKERTIEEESLFQTLEVWYADYSRRGVAIAKHVKIAGKEGAIALLKETSSFSYSGVDMERFIDTQTFISTYVVEKHFVDIVERNAAYMDTGEKKTIGEIYSENGKIDITKMDEGSGSVNIGETSLFTNQEITGVEELSMCQIEYGSGKNLRNILTPDGKIIAKDIPLDALDTTISQLGRFYMLGLGVLAPHMNAINIAIAKARPDEITGTDGTYGIKEDEKFLEIMARLLYGNESIPSEKNIPNLIRVFQSTDPAKKPIRKLRESGIIDDSKQVYEEILKIKLMKASEKVG